MTDQTTLPPRRRLGAFAAIGFGAVLAIAAPLEAEARGAPESFADLAEQLLPAVVNIASTQAVSESMTGDPQLDEFFKEFFERNQPEGPRRETSLGSGFVVDPDGFIVTNNHVIQGADEVTVRLHDGTELMAEVIGFDDKTDLALLKVEPSAPLAYVSWGDSEAVRIGDWVLAIGNPFGLGGSVTAGIVSARQRDINAGPYDDFLQTDAAINRGNSGGPMFNMDGAVIGVNTAIFSPSGGSIGIGFAIPANQAKSVIDQLREFGFTRRGWIGVRIQSVDDELAEGRGLETPTGALVANVTPGGPAETAGIVAGDVILEFDDKKVRDMRALPRIVAETPIGKTVDVVVWRDNAREQVRLEVGELDEGPAELGEEPQVSEAPPEQGSIDLLGVSVASLTPEIREAFQIGEDIVGVVITEVDGAGPAAGKGLQPGDVIIDVDQKPVASPDDVLSRVEEARDNGHRVVTLFIQRLGDTSWVALRIDKS
ncbi:MAG: DegQ family serine endoprotease [Rhodospirillaceae bacterium]|nr:DegQ family serine endoprotease [Rhodospirillaceae bacterium]